VHHAVLPAQPYVEKPQVGSPTGLASVVARFAGHIVAGLATIGEYAQAYANKPKDSIAVSGKQEQAALEALNKHGAGREADRNVGGGCHGAARLGSLFNTCR
jgi:hypothetical protein